MFVGKPRREKTVQVWLVLRHLSRFYPNRLDEVSPQRKHAISCAMRTNDTAMKKILGICLDNNWIVEREEGHYNMTKSGYDYFQRLTPILEKIFPRVIDGIRSERW